MEEKNSNLPCTDVTPWLVGNSKEEKMQSFYLPSESKYYLKSIPELQDKLILFSKNGLLLLRDLNNLKMLSVWNLFSSRVINLPPLDYEVAITCSLIVNKEVDDDGNLSVYLFIDGSVFCYHPLKDNTSWILRSTKLGGERAHVWDVITCNGIVYGHTSTYLIVVIEISDNDSDLDLDMDMPLVLRHLGVEVPDHGFLFVRLRACLLESCGRVYNVTIHGRVLTDKQICAVHVWELDLRSMKWVRIKCLDDRVFLIGNTNKCSTWCWGSTNIQGNSVFFVGSESDNLGVPEALYSYDLEDCSLTSTLPCPTLPSPSYPHTWIMTQCQQRLIREEVGNERVGQLDKGHNAIGLQGKEDEEVDRFSLWEGAGTSYPLLMFFESDDQFCKLMNPCTSDSRCMIFPESFKGEVHIDFAKDGFLLLCTDAGSCLEFFNPFTGLRGKFPFVKIQIVFHSVGFSTSPDSSDCVAIGIVDFHKEVYITYLTVADQRWHQCLIPHHPGGNLFSPGISRPLYYKGAFYFLDIGGHLGVFQITNGDGGVDTWEVYGKPQVPSNMLHSSHLVECDGMLLSVFIGEMGKWVRVFRLQLPDMRWVRVESLGNYTLFLSPSSSLAVVSMEVYMRNKIYLSRRRGNDVLFYSLDVGKYNTLGSGDWIEDFSGTKEHLRCCWI